MKLEGQFELKWTQGILEDRIDFFVQNFVGFNWISKEFQLNIWMNYWVIYVFLSKIILLIDWDGYLTCYLW